MNRFTYYEEFNLCIDKKKLPINNYFSIKYFGLSPPLIALAFKPVKIIIAYSN